MRELETRLGTSRSEAGETGLLPRLLSALVVRVASQASTTLWLVGLLTLLAAGISMRFMQFRTDRADLISPTEEFHQRWLKYVDEFGDQSEIVVVIEGPHAAIVRAVMDEIGPLIEAETDLFDRVLYRFDPSGLRSKALQYLTPETLELGLQQLTAYRPILAGHWNHAGIEAYSRHLVDVLDGTAPSGTGHARHAAGSILQEEGLDTSGTPGSAAPALAGTSGEEPAAATAAEGSLPTAVEQRRAALDQARRFSESLRVFLTESGRFESPWPEILPAGHSLEGQFEPNYQITPSGRMGFVFVSPMETNNNFSGGSRSIHRLRQIVAEVEQRHDGVNIGLTGIPILEADEMERSQSDMAWATLISFSGVGLLLFFGFRGMRHPILAMLMLAVGITWSLGWATLAVGHLNILSVSFAAILVGLGIDYAIHYLARYIELRHQGVDMIEALSRTTTSVGTGIVTASITTALAFSCAAATRFQGVVELGIIAGGGVILCAATSFVVLPALIAVSDRGSSPRSLPIPFQGELLRRLTDARPGQTLLVSGLVVLALASCAIRVTDEGIESRVAYDSNLLHLQADEVESVQWQNRIFRETQGSLLFAVSITDDPFEARRIASEYRALPTVSRVEELASYLPVYPPRETRLLVQGFRSHLSHLSALPREFPGLDPLSIGRSLEELFTALNSCCEGESQVAARALDEFLNNLERIPLSVQIEVLSNYQYGMLTALRHQLSALSSVADDEPVSPEDFSEAVRTRFVSENGRWLVRVYPKYQIWDPEPLEEFVQDVRSVDPHVTGTPLQNYEAARSIRESYIQAAMYALIVVTLVLLADSLSLKGILSALGLPIVVIVFALVMSGEGVDVDSSLMFGLYIVLVIAVAGVLEPAGIGGTLVALMPPLVGAGVMFGLLAVLGQDLNPANLIVLPLILGIGVDNGVHVFHDFRRQGGSYRMSPSLINAIMLNSMTSMIGFGSMMVADHQGLASLGLVLTVGVGSCLFVSLVPLPALLTCFSRLRMTPQAVTLQQHSIDDPAEPHVVSSPAASLSTPPGVQARSDDARRLPKAG